MDYGLIALVALGGVVAGYTLARLDALCGALAGNIRIGGSRHEDDDVEIRPRRKTRRDEPETPAVKISIDDAKFVGAINTAGMEKTEHSAKELGKTTQTNDDIGSSVSKLAQLKGK